MKGVRIPLSSNYCSPGEVVRNAECLLGRVEEVRGVLRGKGFSEHAIDQAITVVYRVAMPYITGTRICKIENRRAWVFKVAIRAAIRATRRDVRFIKVEPAILAATVKDPGCGVELFDIRDALKQLTKQQSAAIELCIVREMSQRAAAKEMDIAVSTLCGHLSAAKERLKEILIPLMPPRWSKHYDPSATASYTVEKEILPLLTSLPCSGTASNGCDIDEGVA